MADKVVQADLMPLKSDPAVKTDKLYYWSGGNDIHATQGGFSGKVLNGNYTEYYLNKNLKVQGQFMGGLKDGIWKAWNENGMLTELYSWDDGERSGKFEMFGNDGKLKQAGYYKDDLLHGDFTTYAADGKAETVYYSNGKVTKKPSFLGKINVLKRLGKDSIGAVQPTQPKQ
ncbi:toxin-antitoxin system YwqK family antitoxin [Mucilaginibacter sp. HD30]